jgi:hypothetical protein
MISISMSDVFVRERASVHATPDLPNRGGVIVATFAPIFNLAAIWPIIPPEKYGYRIDFTHL